MKRARIILQAVGDGDGPVWDGDQRLSIGRMPGCDVVLDDASISRRHAEIMHTESGWVVRDLGSTNGTRLNGVRLGRIAQPLREGDELQPGRVVLAVKTLQQANESGGGIVGAMLGDTLPPVPSPGHATAECTLVGDNVSVAHEEQPSPRVPRSDLLAASDPLRDFLTSSLGGAVAALAAQRGAVFLVEANNRKLVLKASCSGHAPDRTFAYDGLLVQRCFQQSTSFLCADVQALEDGMPVDGAASDPARSVVCVPLRDARQLHGVLCFERAAPSKPFTERDQVLAEGIAATVAAGITSAQQLLDRHRQLFMHTLLTLAQAVDCRDPYTAGHTQRVTEYALLLAEEVQVTAAEYNHLQIGTPLHDIGKIGIEDAILRKPGRLTPAEFAEIQAHPAKGVALLEPIPELAPVLPIVGSHHEHWDGSGYPDGLIGEIIPSLARLVTVADVFDALTTDRPYRKALSAAEAFNYLQRNSGTLFDPQFAQAFLRLRPRIEAQLRERATGVVTVNKRELDQLKETLKGEGIRGPVRPGSKNC